MNFVKRVKVGHIDLCPKAKTRD